MLGSWQAMSRQTYSRQAKNVSQAADANYIKEVACMQPKATMICISHARVR